MRAIRRGRVEVEVNGWAVNRPRFAWWSDGPRYVGVGFTYGNGNSDPVVSIDLDLAGTAAGRLIERLIARRWERQRKRLAR